MPAPPHRSPSTGLEPTRRSVLLAGVALLVTACVGSSDAGQEIRGNAAPAEVDPRLVAPTVAALNAFAFDLLHADADDAPNLVLAPLPVATALAMARAGATEDTRSQLDTVLHAEALDLDAGLAAVGAQARSRNGERRNDRRKGQVDLDLASALFAPRGTHFSPSWLDLLSRRYGQGPRVVDVVSDPEAAREAINRWAADATSGHITELVPRGDVSQYTRFLAATASYLQAPWAREFDRDRTKPAPFTFADGSTADVPTMQVVDPGGLALATGDGWEAVEVPYLGGELALLVVVPDAGRFDEVAAGLGVDRLGTITDALTTGPVDLRLPSFGFTTQTDLGEVVAARLGAPAAFSSRDADFTGITADEFLSLSGLPFQGYFSVDEEGTEGRATTVRDDRTVTGAQKVAVDRPFLFVVRDRTSGLVLLLGRVRKPR